MFRIVVAIGEVEIRLETDTSYPDCIDDITNRTKDMLASTVKEIVAAGWSPLMMEVEEELDSTTDTD
jgi:hypothetical protein